jgi:hypothetical protein
MPKRERLPQTAGPMPNHIISANSDHLNRWFDERFALKMGEWRKQQTPTLSMLVTRGTLD